MTDKTKTAKPKPDLQEELRKEVARLRRTVRPGFDAQEIRSSLSTSIDSALSKEVWLLNHAPDYVWDLLDIAAQWGINHGSLYGARSPTRWKSQ